MNTKSAISEKAKRLSELIGYYEVCNRAEGKSPRTIDWYTANLNGFRSYLNNRHLPDSIDILDTKLLREYVLYLLNKNKFSNHPNTPPKTEPLSSATIHGHVRTLRAFSSWLVREGLIETSFAKDLKPPKISKKVITTLSDEEILSILKTFNPANPSEARNQTVNRQHK
jgi:site-specific recombinase XerD